jgi:penicillin amidase
MLTRLTLTRLRTHLIAAAAIGALSCSPSAENNGEGEPDMEDVSPSDMAESDLADTDAGDGGTPDGPLTIATLSAPVEAHYDEAGVLHVQCEQDRDCLVAQGYFHARDRFLQMDLLRNQTRGRLSEMAGFLTGEGSDAWNRKIHSTLDGDPLPEAYVEAASEETKEAFRAYAEGVNAWLGHLREGRPEAKLPAEYTMQNLLWSAEDIRDWEPADSAALLLALSYQYAPTPKEDYIGLLMAELDPAVVADLFIGRQAMHSSIIPVSQTTLLQAPPRLDQQPIPRALQERLRPHRKSLRELSDKFTENASLIFGPWTPGQGSNNWAVGPDRTEHGGTLLANDPHLPMSNPAIWYLMEMDATNGSGDLHVAGATIPGGPGMVLGHNEDIAWGVTVAMYDLVDLYTETLSEDGQAVIRDGERVELIQKSVELQGKSGDTRTVDLEWAPDHGPVLFRDDEEGTAITLRWVAQDPGPDLDFVLGLNRASTVDEAEAALSVLGSLNLNWVVADRDGSIGWFPAARVPQRPWASPDLPPWAPLPADGTAEWGPYLEPSDLPSLKDPPAGFIATTNNDFNDSWADNDPTNDGSTPLQMLLPAGPGYRHARVSEVLASSTSHTLDDMSALQLDSKSMHASVIVPEVLQTAATVEDDLSPEATAVVSALDAWESFECPSGLDGIAEDSPPATDPAIVTASSGCTTFHVLIWFLTDEVYDDELADVEFASAFDSWASFQNSLAFLLSDPDWMAHGEAFFDDVTTNGTTETRADVITAALERTAGWLVEQYGSDDPSDWIWGRVHTVTLGSLLRISLFSEGPFPTGGGFQTVRMADPYPGDEVQLHHGAGGSVRFAYELSEDGIDARFALPAGNVHRRDSPFYLKLMERWLNHTDTDLHFGDELPETDESVVLEPSP